MYNIVMEINKIQTITIKIRISKRVTYRTKKQIHQTLLKKKYKNKYIENKSKKQEKINYK